MKGGKAGNKVAVNTEPSSEIVEHLVGEPDSATHLAGAVTALAQRDPRRARHVIESVAASLDEATLGKHTAELEQLEVAALEALGLDAKSMMAAVDWPTAPSGEQS